MDVSSKVLDHFFPIGTIYESTSSTSPAAEFGGTWTQIKGRFLVAAGSNGKTGDELLNLTAGTTGGTSSHTITENEMPQHNHNFSTATLGNVVFDMRSSNSEGMLASSTNSTASVKGSATSWTYFYHIRTGTGSSKTDVATVAPTVTTTVGSNGSGNSYNTLPPYLAIYIWQRTA